MRTKGSSAAARWLIVAVVVGVTIGVLFPDRPGAGGFRASDLAVVATLFLRMVKALVAPLVFAPLSHGSVCRSKVSRSFSPSMRSWTWAARRSTSSATVSRPWVMARWEGSLDVPADTMPDRVATLPRMRALQVVKGT